MANSPAEMYSAETLHKELNIPRRYLRILLTALSKHGFISSTRGRNGGFQISGNAKKISVARVIDAINADHIMDRLASAQLGTVVVIDYLQLLDQKRSNPDLMVQVRALKAFARDNGLIIVFISQIDRSYDAAAKPCPDLADVRLPNPLDLSLFDKSCFMNDGQVHIQAAG